MFQWQRSRCLEQAAIQEAFITTQIRHYDVKQEVRFARHQIQQWLFGGLLIGFAMRLAFIQQA